jgi:hypothetical protein
VATVRWKVAGTPDGGVETTPGKERIEGQLHDAMFNTPSRELLTAFFIASVCDSLHVAPFNTPARLVNIIIKDRLN